MGRRELFRVNTKLRVQYRSFDQFYREYTENISNGGLFLKTENVFEPLTVIDIEIKLPGHSEPLKIAAEVVHVIRPEEALVRGVDPGMGVHFIDFEEGAAEKLEAYVAGRLKQDLDVHTRDRRKHPRIAKKFRIRSPSADVLREYYSKNISKGGLFLETDKPSKVGDRLLLILVHPGTGEELKLSGEVVRVSRRDPSAPESTPGMGIKFIDLNESRKNAIARFVGLDDLNF